MKMILNEKNELEISSIEKLSDGIKVNVENMTMDGLEKAIINAGEIKSLICTFESGDVFAKYYNLSLAAIHKENNTVTAQFKNQPVMASVDVAAELSTMKILIEDYKTNINKSQDIQDGAIEELAAIISNIENAEEVI